MGPNGFIPSRRTYTYANTTEVFVAGFVGDTVLLFGIVFNHQCEWTLSMSYPTKGEALITDRVRSTRGGYIFSLSVSSHPGGGYPIRLTGGGTPSQVQPGGGTPSPVQPGGGVPHPRSSRGGGTPSQVQPGGYPIPGPARGGTPSQVQLGGVPHPRSSWRGTPSRWEGGSPSRWGACPGTPPAGGHPPGVPLPAGVPPHRGYPPSWGTPHRGYPPTGGTPLPPPVLVTPRSVCLLRSRRRTFLFELFTVSCVDANVSKWKLFRVEFYWCLNQSETVNRKKAPDFRQIEVSTLKWLENLKSHDYSRLLWLSKSIMIDSDWNNWPTFMFMFERLDNLLNITMVNFNKKNHRN